MKFLKFLFKGFEFFLKIFSCRFLKSIWNFEQFWKKASKLKYFWNDWLRKTCLLKEVRYNYSAHRSAHSGHSHINQQQPQIIFLQCICSVTTMIIISLKIYVKEHSWSIHLDQIFRWFLVTRTEKAYCKKLPVAK